jgi:hypothetical protein
VWPLICVFVESRSLPPPPQATAVRVHDVATGETKRKWPVEVLENFPSWPALHFSGDDKFFARMKMWKGKGGGGKPAPYLHIYSSHTMDLVGDKPYEVSPFMGGGGCLCFSSIFCYLLDMAAR